MFVSQLSSFCMSAMLALAQALEELVKKHEILQFSSYKAYAIVTLESVHGNETSVSMT